MINTNCFNMILKTLVCLGLLNFCGLAASEITNNDISSGENNLSGIERPCRVYDMFCIREYFAKHSRCKKTYGPVPDPLYKAQSTFPVPRVNLTVTSLNNEYTGLNGRVEEFYINKKTDNLLLAVEFKDFTFTPKETYFRFHRKAKEPIVNVEYIFQLNFTSIVVNIVIPNLKDLKLQDGEPFFYSNDPFPRMIVGPSAFSSTDPQVAATFVGFTAGIPIDQMESIITDAAFYIGSFIQYNICDFGIELL